MTHRFIPCFVIAALSLMAFCGGVQAAPRIGVAAAVKNNVERIVRGGGQPLTVGSELFTNERIRTGEASVAQILFLDKTSLTVGPLAELTLDRFVYDPAKGTGQVVVNAVQGAFRFVTGSQNPRNYSIKTPIGVIGIRGTIVDLIIANGQVTVILVAGSLSMKVHGVTYTLSRPGSAYVFSANGNVQGPLTWDGTIINTTADITFPLYGWRFPGEPPNNGLPDTNLGLIDQLNGIIQRSLTPAPSTGGGNN
jgi:hypothetical protein